MFRKEMGVKTTYASFPAGAYHAMMLDPFKITTDEFKYHGFVDEAQMKWLMGEFESATGLLQADIALGSDTVRVLNLHLASNRISGRELKPVQSLDLQSDSSQRGIYQIFRKIAASARLRATQAEQVRRNVYTSPYPLILTSDFNDLPSSIVTGKP